MGTFSGVFEVETGRFDGFAGFIEYLAAKSDDFWILVFLDSGGDVFKPLKVEQDVVITGNHPGVFGS